MHYEDIMDKLVNTVYNQNNSLNPGIVTLLREVANDYERENGITHEAGLVEAQKRQQKKINLEKVHSVLRQINHDKYKYYADTPGKVEAIYEELGEDAALEDVIKAAIRRVL
jgi:hypothetical protein